MANTRAQQRRANAEAAERRRQREAEKMLYRSPFETSVDRRGRPVSRGGTPKTPATSRAFTFNDERKPVDRRGRPAGITAHKPKPEPAQPTTRRPRTPATPSNKTSSDQVTFGTAFKNARNAGQQTFMYQGSRFTTQTKEEASKPKRTSEFGSAFAAARRAGKKTFSFQGKKFNTNLR